MSGTNSTPLRTPKAMSSRLLTMKFMQRAAASSPPSNSSTPEQSPSKRQKTENSSPAGYEINSLVDISAIRSVLATEEANRQALLDKQALAAGDTRWVLNFERDAASSSHRQQKALHVIPAGFATIDRVTTITAASDEGVEDRPVLIGRRSFGRFNRLLEKLQDPNTDGSSESESESDQEEDSAVESGNIEDNPTNVLVKEAREGAGQKLKAELKTKRKAEKAESIRLASSRKEKEINLNKLTSISGGSHASKQTCHRCGKLGHLQADCPKRRKHKDGDVDRPRKSGS